MRKGKGKLEAEDVIILKEMLIAKVPQEIVANAFNISLPMVKAIATNKRWSDVGPVMIVCNKGGKRMDRTNGTVANLRKHLEENPSELDEIKAEVKEIADKLESGELSMMEMSSYFKKWKRPHGHVVYEIFAKAYRDVQFK